MRVLLDECVDWRLGRDLTGHEVKTARQMGWTTIQNGELLAPAAQHFDVFVTVDRNLSFQRSLGSYAIAVVVIRAYSNRLADLIPTAFGDDPPPTARCARRSRLGPSWHRDVYRDGVKPAELGVDTGFAARPSGSGSTASVFVFAIAAPPNVAPGRSATLGRRGASLGGPFSGLVRRCPLLRRGAP